jgi:hypothetical protein
MKRVVDSQSFAVSPMAATNKKRYRGKQPGDNEVSKYEYVSEEKQEDAIDGGVKDDGIVTEEAEDDGDDDDDDEDDHAVSENAEDEYKQRTSTTDTNFGRVRHVFRFFSFAGSLRVFFLLDCEPFVFPCLPCPPCLPTVSHGLPLSPAVFPRSPAVFPSLLFVHLLLRFLRGRTLFTGNLFLGLFTGDLILGMDGFPDCK